MIPASKNYFVYPDCIDGRKILMGLLELSVANCSVILQVVMYLYL